ncbi:hypothetical protein H7X68_00040 [Candidatus Saccharibacteria bacterium]|nr:hypothetical protein [Candidatus Saccharibacteria bacterium]
MIDRDGPVPVCKFQSDDLPESSPFLDNECGEPPTWGATPLEPTEVVIEPQNSAPKGIPANLAEYIEVASMGRSARRTALNRNSFAYREKTDLENVDIAVIGMLERAKSGYASPAELLHIHHVFGIPSIELGCLKHHYGERIEQLEPMRAAVREAILMHNGELNQAIMPKYEILGSDYFNEKPQNDASGLLMKRETLIGTIDFTDSETLGGFQTRIVERSSFILRIDESSGFPQKLANAIRSITFNKDWSEKVNSAGEIYEIVPALLAANDYKRIIPISTTTLARSQELENKFLGSKEHIRDRQRLYMASAAVSSTVKAGNVNI